MPQVSMTVRMDSELKASFDRLCEQFGMSANTAMNVFARTVVRERRIPFSIQAVSEDAVVAKGASAFEQIREMAVKRGISGMSLEEINEEIRLAREAK